MSYRLSRRADNELIAIYEESMERFGYAQAEDYNAGLRQKFEFLADFPEAARERGEIRQRIRAYPYKAHLIVYSAEEDGIFIIRLPHARSDWINEPD